MVTDREMDLGKRTSRCMMWAQMMMMRKTQIMSSMTVKKMRMKMMRRMTGKVNRIGQYEIEWSLD
jgi:hypothetical protein